MGVIAGFESFQNLNFKFKFFPVGLGDVVRGAVEDKKNAVESVVSVSVRNRFVRPAAVIFNLKVSGLGSLDSDDAGGNRPREIILSPEFLLVQRPGDSDSDTQHARFKFSKQPPASAAAARAGPGRAAGAVRDPGSIK